jgi:DNA mismatch repair ATPase MutL
MPDQPFDVRKAIDQSASKSTLQELAKKGIHRVKVLDEAMIQKLIRDAVENILGARGGTLSAAERDSVVKQSRQELDRLIKDFNTTKDRADGLAQDKVALAQRESELRAEFATREREYNKRIQDEIQKNAEMSQKMALSLENSRSHEDELVKKMEVLFTKSLEGLNKKLSDLRLRAMAGGGMGGGGGGLESVELRPSQATIESLFSQELESNVKAMEKSEGKAGGKLGNALDRLKNLRGGGSPKKDDEEKK